MPSLLAVPSDEKNASGTLISIAQGQLITRTVSALYAHVENSGLVLNTKNCKATGMTKVRSAIRQTIGVYIFAKLEIKFSEFDFFSVAFSIKSMILLAVDC